MTYNLSAVANANTTVQIFQNVNTHIMEGWLGILILIVVTTILYINFVFFTKQPIKSFTGTTFISSIVAMLLYVIGLLPVIAVWIPIIGCGLSIAFWNLE